MQIPRGGSVREATQTRKSLVSLGENMDLLRIAVVELDNWESNFVETTVKIASGIEIAQWRYTEDPKSADLLLVNAETRNGQSLIVRYADTQHSGRPIVIACVDRGAIEDHADSLVLGRPVSYTELIAVLRGVESEIRRIGATRRSESPTDREHSDAEPEVPGTELVAPDTKPEVLDKELAASDTKPEVLDKELAAPDTKPEVLDKELAAPYTKPQVLDEERAAPDTELEVPVEQFGEVKLNVTEVEPIKAAGQYLATMARPAKRFFDITRLAGLLKRASRQDRITEITHPVYPSIRIYPTERFYTSPGDPTSIPEMFRASVLDFSSREIDDEDGVAPTETESRQPLWKLLFCACLFGSEGRLLAHCHPADKLLLIAEPDFEFQPHTAEHRNITRHMMRIASNLEEIARDTGVSIGTVIDFCNACEEIGLISREAVAGEPDELAPSVVRSKAAGSIGRFWADRARGSSGLFRRIRLFFD